MTADDIKRTVEEFVLAARRAVEAGSDGVEIHGANGYLIHQFFAPNANRRVDAYGGSIENRARFGMEVAAAVADAIGPRRVGFRISPSAPIGGLAEGEQAGEFYRHVASELDRLGLAYLHVLHTSDEALAEDIRSRWSRPLLFLRSGRTLNNMEDDLLTGQADVLPIGRWALANPDFIERYKSGATYNEADRATFYGGGARGYTDYPVLAA
jgi:NADPH2 dehydrogenase